MDRKRASTVPPDERVRHGRCGLALLGLLLILPLAGCASERYARPSPGINQRGIASWYGPKFHGRLTANGETYDMHKLTAAHRELPFGTVIEVENLDNGRRIQVRINDRGPFVRGRILDLSYEAARRLGMAQAGLARIELRIVSVGDGASGPNRFTRYTVQLGAFRDEGNATEIYGRLRAEYPEAEIRSADGWHRVRIGDFSKKSEAEELRQRLARSGFAAIVVELR
ncbi:MAG: septal ring lytic transglycosylase RlpA family protein [bacterium]|nr:septal ring lytic transglycosylase RlpA family protein [bacterium]